ncbi:MAG TPA: nucleotide exchange factor GrpE [Chitinophagales bacterium]
MAENEEILNNQTEETSAQNEGETSENIDPRDTEIAELKKQIEEQKDKYLRLFADFDNFKKRNAKERLELIQTAGKDVVLSMLPILDDFERALKAAETATDLAIVKEGEILIYNKMLNALQQKGLKALESKGSEFNVEHHEAITEIPAPTADLHGKVIDEVERGYFLNDKLIRFAKVVVGKKI